MIDQPQQTEPPRYWAQSTARWRQQQSDTPMRRFLGGSPVAVLLRLVLVSILVGALLMWLDIRPAEVFEQLAEVARRLWALGFQSIRDLGNYIVAGAAIVVPLWRILRLLSWRGR